MASFSPKQFCCPSARVRSESLGASTGVSERSGSPRGASEGTTGQWACAALLVIRAYWELFPNHKSQGPQKFCAHTGAVGLVF